MRVNVFSGEIFDWRDVTDEDLRARRVKRLRHRVWVAVNMMKRAQENLGGRLVMATLTYAKDGTWKHSQITWYARSLVEDSGVKYYVWVAELTRRGRVHYHVMFLLPDGERWLKPCRKNGNWLWGDVTWITEEVKRPFYIMKYLQKGDVSRETKRDYPKGARIVGFTPSVLRFATSEEERDYRKWNVPRWFVGEHIDLCDFSTARRVAGGVRIRGTVVYSPYRLLTEVGAGCTISLRAPSGGRACECSDGCGLCS